MTWLEEANSIVEAAFKTHEALEKAEDGTGPAPIFVGHSPCWELPPGAFDEPSPSDTMPELPPLSLKDKNEVLEGVKLVLPEMTTAYTYPGFQIGPVIADKLRLANAITYRQPLEVDIWLLCHKRHYDRMNPLDACYRVLYALRAAYGVHVGQINPSVRKVLVDDSMVECMNIIISVSEEL